MKTSITHWDYCQFLLVSQVNYTQTYFADHSAGLSHDRINRLLRTERLTPRELREQVRSELILSGQGYVLFDDTVVDKRHSFKIENARRQWSGNAKRVIKGIGVVTCVYVNPELDQFWIVDYRLYDPERDGKSKIDHLLEMWRNLIYHTQLPFRTVLMDSWYATMQVMKTVARDEKIYYCPLKTNRQISDPAAASLDYQRVDELRWSAAEIETGKLVHVKKFPAGHQLKLFRLVLSTQRTEYVVTNDLSQDSTDATKAQCAIRWKIEQFHREAKQVTGIEASQCRSQRAQRNHIACAMLVWVRLNQIAKETQTNIYQLKQSLLDDYMRHQLRNPSILMRPA